MTKGSRFRKVLLGTVVLLIALVALGPTLLGLGPGKAIIARAVAARVNGDVEIDSASFGWFGGQSIEGFVIREAGGREAVNVDVSVDRGLVSLLFGPNDMVDVELSGRVAGELRENGSTSFQDLLADAGAGAGGGAEAPAPEKSGEPISLAGVPPFGLDIVGLAVMLELAGHDPNALTLDDLNGHVRYDPGGKLDVKLDTPTTSGALRGKIDVTASAVDLFDAGGALRPAGAVFALNVSAQSLPVPFAPDVEELRQLTVDATTQDLSRDLLVTIHADTVLSDAEPSVLDGRLVFAAPVTPAGALRVGLDTVRGELSGRRVPTALLQPALAGSPIVLARDVGPSVDVTATFAPSDADQAQTSVSLSVAAAAATLELQAVVGADGAIDGKRLLARAAVAPELTGGTLKTPAPVTLQLDSFTLPARGADGKLPLEKAAFEGSVTVTESIAIALAADAPPLAVEGARLVFATRALGERVTLSGGAKAAGGAVTFQTAAALAKDVLRVEATTIDLTASPALVAALQAPSEDPVELLAPSAAKLVLAPFTSADDSVTGRLTLASADVRTSAVPEPVRVADLAFDVTVGLGDEPRHAARGSAKLRRPAGDVRLGDLTCDVTVQRSGETMWPRGTVAVEKLAVGELAALLGHEAATATGWLGATGSVALVLGGEGERRDVTVRSDLPNLSGELRAALGADQLEVSADELKLTLAKGVLDKMLEPKLDPDAPRGATPPPAVTAAGDVPMTLAFERVSIPMGLVRKEKFDPAAFALGAKLRGGPLTLVHPGDVRSTFDEMAVTLASTDLAQGVRFAVNGKAAAGAGANRKVGGFSIDGTVTGLLTEQSTFDASGAAITTKGTAEHLPTAIADAFLGLEGLLIAAVGDEMGAAFESGRFSKRSGWIDGRIDAPQGFVEARLRGQEETLRTSKTRPLKGELSLTPALRAQLLAPIHPILADVRTTEHPIRFALGDGAWLPVDGDLSRLKADFEITIGKVEFDSGSTVLGLLSFFASPKSVIPGSIEPIVGKIRNGVVKYDRFVVRIDQYELAYTGSVDLVKKTLDLRTEVPLKALGASFKELAGYTDKIIVPIVTRGTFAKPKTEIDPKFDLAGAALQAGFGGTIDNLLKGQDGEGLGKLFGDLLGGKKKDGP